MKEEEEEEVVSTKKEREMKVGALPDLVSAFTHVAAKYGTVYKLNRSGFGSMIEISARDGLGLLVSPSSVYPVHSGRRRGDNIL